jgi:hypothetical protein
MAEQRQRMAEPRKPYRPPQEGDPKGSLPNPKARTRRGIRAMKPLRPLPWQKPEGKSASDWRW